MIPATIDADHPRLKTGISGFDQITQGGLVPAHLYLIKGSPGSGKTTLGLQFLLEGLREGEVCLYVSLSETSDELLDTIKSHGWLPGSLIIYELFPRVEFPSTSDLYTFFHASEIELTQTMARLEETIEKTRPQRLVIDSLTELRLITRDPLILRRHLAALKSSCMKHSITVFMLIDLRTSNRQLGLQTLAHGVIHLDQTANQYGGLRRRFKVIKLRGSDFLGGVHDFIIQKGGITLFSRSYYVHPHLKFEHENISSGVADLDNMLGGGVDRGSATLLMGQAGVGKSNIVTRFVWQSAHLGKRCSVFIFDEQYKTYLKRASGLGHDLQGFIDQGLLTIKKVEQTTLTPGEFNSLVRTAADPGGAQVIVIDSLDSYKNVIPTEKFLMIQLNELISYLSSLGITTFLTTAQHGLVVSTVPTTWPNLSVNFLADAVILLQYFETAGRIRKAISVIKKRTGPFDNAIHELAFMNGKGLKIGAALNKFQGIITGVPTYLGPIHELLDVEGLNDSPATASPH